MSNYLIHKHQHTANRNATNALYTYKTEPQTKK